MQILVLENGKVAPMSSLGLLAWAQSQTISNSGVDNMLWHVFPLAKFRFIQCAFYFPMHKQITSYVLLNPENALSMKTPKYVMRKENNQEIFKETVVLSSKHLTAAARVCSSLR